MIGPSARFGWHAAHDGRRRRRVIGLFPRYRPHVAVLAGCAPVGGRRVLERAEGFFEPEAVQQGHIMAGAAETGLPELAGSLDTGVNLAARFVAVGDHPVLIRLRKNTFEFCVPSGPENRFDNVPLNQGETPGHFPVSIFQTMADHAGDPFARSRMPVHVALENRLAQVHAHLRVTANAKVAGGAAALQHDGPMHGVEHGAQLRIGMGRNRPLAIMIRMARAARRRRGVLGLGEKLRVFRTGIDRFRLVFLRPPGRFTVICSKQGSIGPRSLVRSPLAAAGLGSHSAQGRHDGE